MTDATTPTPEPAIDRSGAIEAAILRLTPDQFTRDGKPTLKGINSLIDGFDPMTTAERDELWAERVAEAEAAAADSREGEIVVPGAPSEDIPHGMARITITAFPSDPIPLYVHGVGRWSLRVGGTYTLPVEALDALRNSDCIFTEAA